MALKKQTHRILDVFLWLSFSLLLLLAVLKLLFPAENYTQQIKDHISAALGHSALLGGEINWVVIPKPGVYVEKITIKSLGVELQEAFIAVNPWALLRLQIEASQLKVSRLSVAGASNIRFKLNDFVVGLNDDVENSFEFVLGVENYDSTLPAKKWLFSGQLLREQADQFELSGQFQRLTGGGRSQEQRAYHLSASLSTDDTAEEEAERYFRIALQSSDTEMVMLGRVYRQQASLNVDIEKLSTANLNLSAQLQWDADGSWREAAFFGKELRVPTSCFKGADQERASDCRDLILLFSMPGQNSLKVEQLLLGEYQFKELRLRWLGGKKRLQVSEASAKAFSGSLEGKATLNRLENSIDFSLQATDVDVAQAAAWLPADRYLSGNGNISLSGAAYLPSREYQIQGKAEIMDGEIKAFNLQEQLCRQFEKDLQTDISVTPYQKISSRFKLSPARWNFEHFQVQMDGAHIEGSGELQHDRKLRLDMQVSVEKRQWPLCTLPHVLTTTAWPFNCVGMASEENLSLQNSCSVDFTQLGINALKLMEDDTFKDQLDRLKSKDKVKKVLDRLDRWLEE